MSNTVYYVICALLACGVLLGISMMSKVKTAVYGNGLSAVCTLLAILVTLYQYNLLSDIGLWVCLAIGLAAGLFGAYKVKMIEMPQAVALLNGFGGAASALVAAVSVLDGGGQEMGVFSLTTAGLALAVGTVTLTGSLVAAGKLHKVLPQKPVVLPCHRQLTMAALVLTILTLVLFPVKLVEVWLAVLLCTVLSGLFGIVFAIRVGGADMPITISLLNSLSGVAGSIAGMAIGDPLLVAIGGIVGASGLLLTEIMCHAMNRKLADILSGKTSMPAGKSAAAKPKEAPVQNAAREALQPEVIKKDAPKAGPAEILAEAKKVIIVPGYGMALAQAQSQVKQLSDYLEGRGAEVKFAIHPVAGRMPGHMNVLLCEVDVPYEQLYEMDAINGEFKDCDAVLVVGANDVLNPAANTAEGTPIYGMPVLDVGDAKHIIFCNYDLKPGYAGVENPLYSRKEGVYLLLGDAAGTVGQLCSDVRKAAEGRNKENTGSESGSEAQAGAQENGDGQYNNPAWVLAEAKKVIIVPGYGMALAQAQRQVKQLCDYLEGRGTEVKFAIHPVAGRMPGHMNVLLCEVDVPYEQLYEMDAINGEFKDCDAAVVVGANDVLNPAANTAEGTPIYGMPVLDVADAKHIIFCNYDLKPGYAGVDNPLYARKEGVSLLLGDAADTVGRLLSDVREAVQRKEQGNGSTASDGSAKDRAEAQKEASNPAAVLNAAKKVIIVPGYGMALAQAQRQVKQLSDYLENRGTEVKFAIHPVAGRMPGHMNVLLCEVDVPYEQLYEMDAINGEFKDCDAVLVVGANDVLNPAANTAEGTPIYGMPVLNVEDAKYIVFCNYDLKPGYAGVENPLYTRKEGVSLLLGDAAKTLEELMNDLRG